MTKRKGNKDEEENPALESEEGSKVWILGPMAQG